VEKFYAPVTLSAPSSAEKELKVQTAETANGIAIGSGLGVGCWPPAGPEPITKLIIPNSANTKPTAQRTATARAT